MAPMAPALLRRTRPRPPRRLRHRCCSFPAALMACCACGALSMASSCAPLQGCGARALQALIGRRRAGEFIYRYISCESCSQFGSLPLTYYVVRSRTLLVASAEGTVVSLWSSPPRAAAAASAPTRTLAPPLTSLPPQAGAAQPQRGPAPIPAKEHIGWLRSRRRCTVVFDATRGVKNSTGAFRLRGHVRRRETLDSPGAFGWRNIPSTESHHGDAAVARFVLRTAVRCSSIELNCIVPIGN